MGVCWSKTPSQETSVINQNAVRTVPSKRHSESEENPFPMIESSSASSRTQGTPRNDQSTCSEQNDTLPEMRHSSISTRRERREIFSAGSGRFKAFYESGLEGGIAFIYGWRKNNAFLSNKEMVLRAADGIRQEGALLVKYMEADELASRLLKVQDASERDILKCCLYLYTIETFLYRLVNKVLRENDTTKMDTVAPFCYFLTEAIWSDTLARERFRGTVYRGMNLNSSQIHSYKAAIGTYKCWYGFTSSSYKRHIAEAFGNSVFIIDISATGGLALSSTSEFPDEDEVLLPPGTTVRIDTVNQTGDKTYIHLYAVPELRVVLLGRTGSGKSSFGNSILGNGKFIARKSLKSVTKQCSVNDRIIDGRRLLVVDTPGFFDTELRPKDLIPEICSSYQVAAPGPHAFLIVFTVERFTEQEQAVARWICEVFDERALDYCIIVFTGLDHLERENQTIEQFLQDAPDSFRALIEKCNGRYIAVDNTADADKKEGKTKVILESVSEMVRRNGGQFYNNHSFIQIANVLEKYSDWYDPVKSDGTIELVKEATKILAKQLKGKAIFNEKQ